MHQNRVVGAPGLAGSLSMSIPTYSNHATLPRALLLMSVQSLPASRGSRPRIRIYWVISLTFSLELRTSVRLRSRHSFSVILFMSLISVDISFLAVLFPNYGPLECTSVRIDGYKFPHPASSGYYYNQLTRRTSTVLQAPNFSSSVSWQIQN